MLKVDENSDKITRDWLELVPAYGRDYKSQAEAIAAFESGDDWTGDYNIGFTYCSVRDFAPGVSVLLRYKKLTMVVSHVVGAKPKGKSKVAGATGTYVRTITAPEMD